jgi:NAD(P)-dependent dehydrogenase (short-subunit alcohol dehydrogenase family)
LTWSSGTAIRRNGVVVGAHRYYAPELLAGRTAVVTGGGSGIGLAVAVALAGAGADVLIASRDGDRLAKAEREIASRAGRECAGFPCDVRDPEAIALMHEYALSRFGPVSIVVNNAAANFHMPAERMTERAMRAVVDTDLMGTFNVTREFFPDLVESGHGVVLSVVIAAVDRGFPGYAHAGAAKAAIMSLTGTWASEWGTHGIRANAIAPGPVPTAGVTENMLGRPGNTVDDAFAGCIDAIPLGRLGRPDDVAAAAVYLCSDAASWVSGVTLTLDGGMNLTKTP